MLPDSGGAGWGTGSQRFYKEAQRLTLSPVAGKESEFEFQSWDDYGPLPQAHFFLRTHGAGLEAGLPGFGVG